MRTAAKMRLLILGIVMLLFLLTPIAQASFWAKTQGFYYSPDYGALGATLEEKAPLFEVKKKLEAGYGIAFSTGYDFENNWGIRLDSFSFTGVADYHRPYTKVLIKTSTSPIIVSYVYRIPGLKFNSYLGAGIGIFRSELTAFSTTYIGRSSRSSGGGLSVGLSYRFSDTCGNRIRAGRRTLSFQ